MPGLRVESVAGVAPGGDRLGPERLDRPGRRHLGRDDAPQVEVELGLVDRVDPRTSSSAAGSCPDSDRTRPASTRPGSAPRPRFPARTRTMAAGRALVEEEAARPRRGRRAGTRHRPCVTRSWASRGNVASRSRRSSTSRRDRRAGAAWGGRLERLEDEDPDRALRIGRPERRALVVVGEDRRRVLAGQRPTAGPVLRHPDPVTVATAVEHDRLRRGRVGRDGHGAAAPTVGASDSVPTTRPTPRAAPAGPTTARTVAAGSRGHRAGSRGRADGGVPGRARTRRFSCGQASTMGHPGAPSETTRRDQPDRPERPMTGDRLTVVPAPSLGSSSVPLPLRPARAPV